MQNLKRPFKHKRIHFFLIIVRFFIKVMEQIVFYVVVPLLPSECLSIYEKITYILRLLFFMPWRRFSSLRNVGNGAEETFRETMFPRSGGTFKVGSLSTRVFETWAATGSELFSLLTCFHATTFTLLSIFFPIEIISTKSWETPLSWHAKFSLPVAVRVSKTRVLKLPTSNQG